MRRCGSKKSPRREAARHSDHGRRRLRASSSGRARGSSAAPIWSIYSGGKFLRGPQTSGLLLGSKPLVEAAWRNASPHQALGRPMKVSKEDIIGVLTALEYWFEERDQAAERQKWYDDWRSSPSGSNGCRRAPGEVIEPQGVDPVPRLRSRGTAGTIRSTGWSCASGARRRAAHHARRQFGDRGFDRDRPVPIAAGRSGPGRRRDRRRSCARRRSRSGAGASRRRSKSPAIGNCGSSFCKARAIHRLELEQRGARLAGHQRSAQFEGPVAAG